MKKFTKMALASGVTFALGIGVVTSYLVAQPKEQLSDLTLANIEAIGAGMDVNPIVQGPAHESKDQCRACKTHHVICEGRENGGDCINIHCLL